jgi:acetyl esterase/lipase
VHVLWPDGPPGPPGADRAEEELRDGESLVVRNVTQPTLTVFTPEAGTATRTAVVLAPGGGFHFLAWDYEGVEVARRLAAQGITTFLLKYRVADTGPTEETYRATMAVLMRRLIAQALDGRGGTEPLVPDVQVQARQDAAQAVRVVRQRATDWGIDPARVGFLGFSAGAYLATALAAAEDADARPTFLGAIYGGEPPPAGHDTLPPLFSALAADDLLVRRQALEAVHTWMEAGRPVELHLYERGGHGFGARALGLPSDSWMDRMIEWMRTGGLL